MNNNSETVKIEINEQFVSPYKLASIASELTGRLVRPQMIYSYCKQNLIASSLNDLGKHQVRKEDAEAWLNKFVPKHSVK